MPDTDYVLYIQLFSYSSQQPYETNTISNSI